MYLILLRLRRGSLFPIALAAPDFAAGVEREIFPAMGKASPIRRGYWIDPLFLEYQVWSSTAPTLLGDFGREGVWNQWGLLWFSGLALDNLRLAQRERWFAGARGRSTSRQVL